MAHQSNIAVGGYTVPVWEFDSTAQQIDNVVAVLGNPSTPQEALAALGAAVQENELDNAFFAGGGIGYGVFPVNQRGKTQYTEPAPMFDRWKYAAVNNGATTLTPNGLSITGGEPYSVIRQALKRALPVGAPYTISILNFDGTFSTGTITVPDKEEYSGNVIFPGLLSSVVRLLGPDTLEFVAWSGENIKDLEFVKLEPGNTQTAAHKKPDGKWAMLPQNLDYRRELAKCQSYLWVPQRHSEFTMLGVGHAVNANYALVTVVPPVAMRTGGAPTVSIPKPSDISLRGTGVYYADGVSVEPNSDGTPIVLSVTGTFNPGDVFDVFISNSGSIEFSREL